MYLLQLYSGTYDVLVYYSKVHVGTAVLMDYRRTSRISIAFIGQRQRQRQRQSAARRPAAAAASSGRRETPATARDGDGRGEAPRRDLALVAVRSVGRWLRATPARPLLAARRPRRR